MFFIVWFSNLSNNCICPRGSSTGGRSYKQITNEQKTAGQKSVILLKVGFDVRRKLLQFIWFYKTAK